MRSLLPFLIFFSVSSADLGVFGETFEICEKDLLEHIFSRLRGLQETGKLESEKEKVQERVKDMILHPRAVAGITRTEKEREYKFDPTITVTRDLSDHRGRIFARKGDRFNPLDKMSFSKPLLFIDGEDEDQVKWVIAKIKENALGKVILVKGSPLDLQKRLADSADAQRLPQASALQAIYFDQRGLLTTKFGIRHVPAIVFQKEVAIADRENVLTVREEVAAAGKESICKK